MDRQTEIVNKSIEGYLSNNATGQQTVWIKWLHLGKYCCNITQHISISMSPFKALYGYNATPFMDLIFSDSRVPSTKDVVQQSKDILAALKENLKHAQNQQKLIC